MKEKIILFMLGQIIKMITGERLRKLADVVLDFVEKEVTESKNKYDDNLQALCKVVRVTFDIPDND